MSAPSKVIPEDAFNTKKTVQNYIQRRPRALVHIPVRLIIERLKQLGKVDQRSGCLLDVGCGSGESTRLLAKNFHHTIGVDPSAPMISYAIAFDNEISDIEFKVANAEKLPIEDSSVDVITAMFVVHYADLEKFIPECKRVLKPGGVAIFYRHQISKILSAEDDALPVIDGPVKRMIRRLLEKAREMSHPSFHTYELHQTQFDAISWEKKSREINELEFAPDSLWTLGSWSRFYHNLPFYQKAGKNGVNPVTELVQAVKNTWSMQDRDSDDIKIRVVYTTVMILLE